MKSLSEFYYHKQNQRYRPDCKICVQARGQAHYAENPDAKRASNEQYRRDNPEKFRGYTKKSVGRFAPGGYRHRITWDEWNARWAAQEGRCYLCGDLLDEIKGICIDHDHRCCGPNRSCAACRRGLSCLSCNSVIGLAGDDPNRLRALADALEEAQAHVDAMLQEHGRGLDDRAKPYTEEQRRISARLSHSKWEKVNRESVNAARRQRYAASRDQVAARRQGYGQQLQEVPGD